MTTESLNRQGANRDYRTAELSRDVLAMIPYEINRIRVFQPTKPPTGGIMYKLISFVLVALVSSAALAADYALSWTVSSPTGITEYAIGSKVATVTQPVEYTGTTGLSKTVTRATTAGQTVDFYIAACSATACGAWGPAASLVAGSTTPPAGTVLTTTATSVRVGPPALP
jgi:hypothetical protein